MNDKLLQLLASAVIFVILLFIIIKLYYYSSHISPEKKYPITLELATAISYAVSVPGDMEIYLPANIVYENEKGDLYSVFATELKINNKEKEYKIVYGVCYYRELENDVKKALADSISSALEGVLLRYSLGRTFTWKRGVALTGGSTLVEYFSGWLYKDVDFEKIYLSSLKHFENSVAENIIKAGSENTVEEIANYAIIFATAAALAFDGLGLAALAAATIIARIAIPLIYWATGPDSLKNCWYGDPKNWNFVKMHEDFYFWNPEFSLEVWIIKKEKDTIILKKAPNKDTWWFINPSPVVSDIENQKYIAVNEIMLRKGEEDNKLEIIAFVESE